MLKNMNLNKSNILQSNHIQNKMIEPSASVSIGLAHDFNNLMSCVLGYTELILSETTVDDKTLKYIFEIQKSGRIAAVLSQKIMANAKEPLFKLEIVNLNSLIMENVSMLRVLLPGNIKLSLNLSQELDMAKVDSEQIIQVLINLIINARDALPDGGNIIIKTENICIDKFSCKSLKGLTPGNYTVLMISDTGFGMDTQTRSKIFEPFFTTKDFGEGNGLGLSNIFRIIQKSGGSIYTYSELNYGTTFKIYLPLALKKKYKIKKTSWKLPALAYETTILVVGFKQFHREDISRILIQSGYHVYQSGSGREAVRLIENLHKYDICKDIKIDLLISAIKLPGKNEQKLVELLQKENPQIKRLFISGYTDEIIDNNGILGKNVSFLSKPYSLTNIMSKVDEILNNFCEE